MAPQNKPRADGSRAGQGNTTAGAANHTTPNGPRLGRAEHFRVTLASGGTVDFALSPGGRVYVPAGGPEILHAAIFAGMRVLHSAKLGALVPALWLFDAFRDEFVEAGMNDRDRWRSMVDGFARDARGVAK